MSSFHIFRPEERYCFSSLPNQFRIIRQMGKVYRKLISQGRCPKHAFYAAYVITHPTSEYDIATGIGADRFYQAMTNYLRMTRHMLEDVIKEYHRPFRNSLAAYNAVTNALVPLDMFELAIKDPGAGAKTMERRIFFEARRNLGIALQLFGIEQVDSDLHVARDLVAIDQLSTNRLFSEHASVNVKIVAWQDDSRDHRIAEVNLFMTTKKERCRHRTRVRDLERGNIPFITDTLTCRVAEVNGRSYLVYAIERGKRLFATLLKLERGRSLADRRGWKYVVVGVIDNGDLQPASREDAITFLEHTRQTLWKPPLQPEEDTNPPNPGRDESYWDCKITGRYHHEQGRRIISGPAEQLVTTLTDHLDATHARADVNHMLYRASQIDEHINPLWFPHNREAYKGTIRIVLPRFGVDWSSEDVQKRLRTWRMALI